MAKEFLHSIGEIALTVRRPWRIYDGRVSCDIYSGFPIGFLFRPLKTRFDG